jgi:hypothetical protein
LFLLAAGIFLMLFGSGHAAAPIVATSGTPLAYTENQPAQILDGGVTINEPDGDDISGATVQITGNYAGGEDVLSAGGAGPVSVSWNAGTGTLTFSGTAPAATYEAALHSITYVNTSDNPSTSTRTVTYLVTDVNAESGSNTVDVNVTATDDALTFTTTAGSLNYTESTGAVAADSGLTLADVDSVVTGATVQVTGNYVNGEDVLGFANQLGITGGWNAGTATLTLTGNATAAAYQTALRAVTYTNTSNNPSVSPRTLTYTVQEAGTSASGVRVVQITAVNDPPSAGGNTTVQAPGGGAVSVLEDATPGAANIRLVVPVLSDVEGPAPTQVRIMSVTGGTLVQADGSGIGFGAGGSLLTLSGGGVDLRFTPTTNRDTNGSLSYVVVDGANPGVNSTASTAAIPITPVNDPPVLTGSGGSAAFVENGAATVVDSGITLSDVDDTNLEGATVRIATNYTSSEDTLSFTGGGGITGSWDGSTGTLTLSGTASVAAYQSALRSVTYANSSENPASITRGMTFVVNDGTDPSGTHSRSVTVTAVNDAPVVTAGGSATYNENGAAVTLDGGVTVSDVDSANLAGATVTITGNYASGEDVLAFGGGAGITGSWNATTGRLTLTGAATAASYQAALRSITYVDTSDAPSTAARTVTYVVNDGTDPSAAATASVTVVASNDAPVLSTGGGGIAYTENDAPTALAPGVTLGDLDDAQMQQATLQISANYWNGEDVLAFADQNGISGSWDATSGTLTLSGAASVANYQSALRSVTYEDVSDDPSNAVRTVTYQVDDGTDPSNTDTRTVTVTPVNDPPAIGLAGGVLIYTEGDRTTAVDPNLTVTELDDPTLTRAQARAPGLVTGEEYLTAVGDNGITVTSDRSTGTL